jgi:hypothetical protein
MGSRTVTAKAILLAFALCAVFDFVWGYYHGHSITRGVVSVILGLFGTALACWLLMGGFRRDGDKSDTSRR